MFLACWLTLGNGTVFCIRSKFQSHFCNPLRLYTWLKGSGGQRCKNKQKKQSLPIKKSRDQNVWQRTHVSLRGCVPAVPAASIWPNNWIFSSFSWERPHLPQRVTQERAVTISGTWHVQHVLHACQILLGLQVPAELRFGCASIFLKRSTSLD